MINTKKGFTSTIADYPERGQGGDQCYRGNCSPKLIEDLISQYSIQSLSDYMVGSGTTRDVCRRLQVQGEYLDLNCGFDLITMDIPSRPENIFWHPPYHDIIVYSGMQYKTEDVIRKYGFDPQSELLGTKVPSIWKQFQILIMCRCKWAATTNPVHRGTTAGK